jgi:hypothetical protein
MRRKESVDACRRGDEWKKGFRGERRRINEEEKDYISTLNTLDIEHEKHIL